MKNSKKLLSLTLAGAMSLGLLAGCSGGDSNTPAETGSGSASGGSTFDLRVSIASEPATIDPAKNSTVDGAIMVQHMFEGLMKWDNSGEPIDGARGVYNAELVPGQAAAEPEKVVNEDGTVTYTFTLRDDLKWSDGEPLTANDFVYSWQRLADPSTAADYCYMIDMVKGYAEINTGTPTGEKDEEGNDIMEHADPSTLGVSAPDDHTFVVELTYDCPYFLEVCAFPATLPVRQDVVAANPDGWTHEVDTYLSNGAYTLTEWSHNSRIVMAKNQYYYGVDELGPDTITFQLMDDGTATLSAYNSGDLDYIQNVPVDEIPSLLASGELNIVDYIGTYYVSYNVEDPAFSDPRVRKAFTLAINSKYIVDNVSQAGEVPATGFVPAGVYDADQAGDDFRTVGGDYWTAPLTDEQYQANVAEAQQLMADAGYPNGEGFPVVVYTYNNDPNHEAVAQALQQQWQTALGVTVTLENADWSVFLEDRKQGNYMVARNGWIADYNDPCSFLDMWYTDGGNNDAQYSNPEYDALIDAAKATSDPAERMDYFHQAEDILFNEDWVLGPIYFYTQKYMLKDNIDNIYYTPLGYFFFTHATKAEG